jgi:prephenate dehydrogenase
MPGCDTRVVHVAIIGLGLIGGSVARALHRAPDARAWTVAAWSPTGAAPRRAVADGVISRAASSPVEAIDGADLIVLAGPPGACLEGLEALAGPWAAARAGHAVVTDVASTKGAIVARADELGLRFVGGHPMAGVEAAGYAASTADLLVDRPWVVVPGDTADEVATLVVETLVVACRAQPLRLDAVTHDAVVAGISHLPLVLAAALVEAIVGSDAGQRADWPIARVLAAGGWRDMTRLARGDVVMGAGIATTNAPALAARIRDVRAVLDGWLGDLEAPGGPNETALVTRLRAARERLGEPS